MEDLISETARVLSFSGYSRFLVNDQLEALFSMYLFIFSSTCVGKDLEWCSG
jgi:hypothetical protein